MNRTVATGLGSRGGQRRATVAGGLLRRGWRVALLIAALLAPAGALAAGPPDLAPRIVMQRGFAYIEVAAWTPDDRFIVTASGVGLQATVWDVALGVVLDVVDLPPNGRQETVVFTGLTISEDGATATLRGLGFGLAGERPRSCDYRVDLRSREATLLPERKISAADQAVDGEGRLEALTTFNADHTLTDEDKPAGKLPKLPVSHDGRTKLRRHAEGLILTDAAGPRPLRILRPNAVSDAGVTPNGRALVILVGYNDEGKPHTTVERILVATGQTGPPLQLDGEYEQVAWTDDGLMFLTPSDLPTGRRSDDSTSRGPPGPALLLDAADRPALTLPPMCFVAPLGKGAFVGAEPANCRNGVDGGHRIVVYDSQNRWTPLPFEQAKDMFVNRLAVAPVGPAVAAILEDADHLEHVLVFDRDTHAVVALHPLKELRESVFSVRFTPDGQTLILSADGALYAWRPGDRRAVRLGPSAAVAQMLVITDEVAVASSVIDHDIKRTDLRTGQALPPLDFGRSVAGGFVAGAPVFWAVSQFAEFRFWDTRDWSVMLKGFYFETGARFAATPDGRYDTNLGPDTKLFRWVVPDRPFQSLAPQTFMRDYYEPGLAEKVWTCHLRNDCAQALKPLPPIASLNRVLPLVRIAGVSPGAGPGEALVDVEVREGVDATAPGGRDRSGAYDLRLFRNGQLEAQLPPPAANDQALARPEWRRRNRLALGPDGVFRTRLRVRLPIAEGAGKTELSAYVFNEDRVKSETATQTYSPTVRPQAKARPKAYVLTIGIDAYDEPRLALQFAANDARLLGDWLAAIPDYETHRLTLAGARDAGGRPRRLTRDVIAAAFGLLADGDRPALLARLAKAGIDGSALQPSTPDDVIIITFAGHGWADPRGGFYLVPADGRWTPGGDPDTASLISTADLTNWLRPIASAEMAMIIDACHSAASVQTIDFKPGPMGDPGLGQLAFDKRIWILAATQADDVALEDAGLRQGLLTYALAGGDVAVWGPGADQDQDGAISLFEWLRHGRSRLPALSEDARLGRFAAGPPGAGRGFGRIDSSPAARPKPQQPVLFDYGLKSKLILKRLR